MKLGLLLFLLAVNVALATLNKQQPTSDPDANNSFLTWLSHNDHDDEECKCMTTDEHGHIDVKNGTSCNPCAHHTSIFKLGEELDDNPMTLTILFLIMAGLSFMFEKSTHWLEHKIKKHHHIMELLTAVYKELMVLGFINLVLFCLEQAGFSTLKFEGEEFDRELFEFIHMFLFFQAVFYIITVIVLLVMIRAEWKRWKVLSFMSKEAILSEYAKAFEERQKRGCLWLCNPWFVPKYMRARQNKQFYLIRSRFVMTQIIVKHKRKDNKEYLHARKRHIDGPKKKTPNPSPPQPAQKHVELHPSVSFPPISTRIQAEQELNMKMEKFDFGKYLRRIVRHDVVEIIEIDWRIWAVLMLIAIANIVRLKAGGQFHSPNKGVSAFVICGAVFFGLFLLILIFLTRRTTNYYTRLKRSTTAGELFYSELASQAPANGTAGTIADVDGGDGTGARTTSDTAAAAKGSGVGSPRLNSIQVVRGQNVPPLEEPLISHNPIDDTEIQMKSYFLLRNPHFTLRLIQMLVLMQSFFLSLYVLVFAHRINNEFHGVSVLAMHLVTILPPLVMIFVILPNLLPLYSMLAHVENLTTRRDLIYVLTYEDRKRRIAKRNESDDEDEGDPHGHGGHGGGGGGHARTHSNASEVDKHDEHEYDVVGDHERKHH